MCEFSVFLKREAVFRDAVYAKADGNKVVIKGVLGESQVFENCRIVEVDVGAERLVLSQIKTH